MANIVLKLAQEKIDSLRETYQQYAVTRNAPGVVFAAKLPSVAVTVYSSGKVMFQGQGAEEEARRWGVAEEKTATLKTQGDHLPAHFASLSVIGSDETGTGDYFGPITVAAVYVPQEKIALVETLGVKDSKMLTDDYMRKIAPDLMAACTHSVLVLRNERYNDLQKRGYSQGKMKALMHNKALQHVLDKMAPEKPQHILIDQFAVRDVYYRHLAQQQQIVQENVLFSTKAENLHVAVAAASIIARYAFLKEMDRLSKIVGFSLQKGASNKVDEMAAKIWQKHGEETLRSISKWHFANTEKACKLLQKKYSK